VAEKLAFAKAVSGSVLTGCGKLVGDGSALLAFSAASCAVPLSSFNFFSAARGSLLGAKQFDEADPTATRRSAGQEEAVFILQVAAGTGLVGPLPTTRSCRNTQRADNATGTPDPQPDSSIRNEGSESGRKVVSQCRCCGSGSAEWSVLLKSTRDRHSEK